MDQNCRCWNIRNFAIINERHFCRVCLWVQCFRTENCQKSACELFSNFFFRNFQLAFALVSKVSSWDLNLKKLKVDDINHETKFFLICSWIFLNYYSLKTVGLSIIDYWFQH